MGSRYARHASKHGRIFHVELLGRPVAGLNHRDRQSYGYLLLQRSCHKKNMQQEVCVEGFAANIVSAMISPK